MVIDDEQLHRRIVGCGAVKPQDAEGRETVLRLQSHLQPTCDASTMHGKPFTAPAKPTGRSTRERPCQSIKEMVMSRFRDALLRSSAQRFGLSTGRAKGMRLALAAVLCGGGLVLAVAQIRIFASPEVEKKYKLLVAQSLTVQ